MIFDLQSIGREVKDARLLGGISQAALAMRAGVSRATINALENGTIKEIGIKRLSRVVSVAQNLPSASLAGQSTADVPHGKSDALSLSFPYDWSNPNIADEVLILKVIERGLFEDIVRVTATYGLSKVRVVADAFSVDHPFAAPSLRRMLSNISKVVEIA